MLRLPPVARLIEEYGHNELTAAVRNVLDRARAAIRRGEAVLQEPHQLALAVREALFEALRPRLRRVINATGIVLHTGLGRAPLAREALDAVVEVAGGYCNLELDLTSGERGDRHEHVRDLLVELTGAENALVVNNNAAATFLALNSLGAGREVIVSRGELVEIGGSYRMPDIMAAAGCRMVEVGTTNRTHLYDYERAIGDQTAALIRVHTSNYRVQGFVTRPELQELATLAREAEKRTGAPVAMIDDLGSGWLDRSYAGPGAGLPAWDEPTVRESVSAGVDLTMFSGDKLLGGPQAGILVGSSAILARLRKNPLMRALRPDKLTMAALEATLRLYRDPSRLIDRLPTLRMLYADIASLDEVAQRLTSAIAAALPNSQVRFEADESYAGGGTLPTLALPTRVVIVAQPGVDAPALLSALRQRETPIIARIRQDTAVFDCRTIRDDEIPDIANALADAVREARGRS